MDLHSFIRVLAKRWLSILAITGVALAGAVAFTVSAPKIYTAQAQTFIAIGSPGGADGGAAALAPDATYTLQRITSYIQIVGSPEVLRPVIEELGLDVEVQTLARSVSASNPVDTVLINVTASNGDPARAAEVANAVSVQLGSVIQTLETSISGTVVPVKATLTNPAEPPTSPSSPRTRVNLLLGGLLGLAAGIAYALVRESLDTSIKSPDEVLAIVGAPSVGAIAFDPEASDNPIVALDQRAPRAEAFRTIRTNLQYVDVDDPPKVVAITSAVPGEGKSTTAINLAVTMAQAGKRVVLVETDLRRPKASAYLGVDSQLGLTDVLAGRCKLAEVLISWNRGLVTFLPAGHTPPNPSELLASQQFAHVLDTLRLDFDQVIVDGTPLLPVTDGAIVCKASDGAILVVRFGKTTREQLAASVAALEQVDARVLGTALNFVPRGRRAYGYNYAYGYMGDNRDGGAHRDENE